MKPFINLLPGEPDDENRDYLPQKLKGSEITVNENGNDSQVYPKRLKEYTACFLDGVEDTWYEYIPESYDPSRKTPLVLSMHGGLMTGWGQAVYTSWTHVADREGFIVVFPNANESGMWMLESDWEKVLETAGDMPKDLPLLLKPKERVEDYHDVKKTMAVIELMKEKYNIDPGRIYMQGMSMGNAMTSQFARYMGNVLAGAAGSGCPTNTKLLFDAHGKPVNKGGPLDIWQSRLELDKTPPHYREGDRGTVLGNLKYWNMVNEVTELPGIRIRGDYNFTFFRGKKGNNVMMDVKNRDHGQTFDDAELVWDYLFSGCYKDENGVLKHREPGIRREGDAWAAAFVCDSSKAWVNNKIEDIGSPVFLWSKLKYHGLNGEAVVRGTYYYVPVGFLPKIFPVKEAEIPEDGRTAAVTLNDGITVRFAKGNKGCVVDNRIESMDCEAVERGGVLYIPVEWFAKRFYGMHVSYCEEVVYITDHDASLSKYTAWLLGDILKERWR